MAVFGGLQSTIIICGALLRPIVIRREGNPKTDAQELEALSTQAPKDTADSASVVQNGFQSVESELTASTGDSGVQSGKDSDSSSPQEKAVLAKEAELNEADVEKSTEVKASGIDQKMVDVEKQLMVNEEVPTGPEVQMGKPKLLDFTILRECSFIFYSLFGLFATLGFFAPPLYIIEMSVSRGVERENAAYMLSVIAVAEIVGRFTIGWVMTLRCLLKKKVLVLLACIIAMAVDLLGFTLVTEFYGLAVCCALYGFLMGTISCTHIPLLAEDDVVGIERMSSAAGVYVFIHSFAGLAGPPLGGLSLKISDLWPLCITFSLLSACVFTFPGLLVDVTDNYGSAFYSCMVGMAIGALFLGLVRPAKRGLLCRKRKPKPREDTREKKGDPEEVGVVHKPVPSADRPESCSTVDNNVVRAQVEATPEMEELV